MIAVATHSLHTLALAASGCVFSFGHGECGKLGHGDEASLSQPRRIESLWESGVHAVSVSVGCSHSLVLSCTGQLFSFGSGFGGKLGHGDQRNGSTPRAVLVGRGGAPGEGADVVWACVAAGTQHSLAASETDGAQSRRHRHSRRDVEPLALATPRARCATSARSCCN